MAGQRTSFSKLQRDRDKKAKAAAKRERRQERSSGEAAVDVIDIPAADAGQELSADDLLKLIESIHQRFDAGTMSYEEFEEKKVELLARLPID
jgi:hypothetical protein